MYFFAALLSSAVATAGEAADVYPASDPANTGGWMLNADLSDEFEGAKLDDSKWFVQGTGGMYHKWRGRAPSQFAPHNVKVEDGKLKLTSRWEPDYGHFAEFEFDGRKYENITTAGVISHKKFLYGYMEIRSKAADAAMTSSFWTLGYQSELDVFEQMGQPLIPENSDFGRIYMFSIHDWRPGSTASGSNRIFNHKHQLDYRVADDFHAYGCEWGEDYLKFFEDGNLVYSISQKELGDAWLLTNPLEIWFDSETFPWMGLPKAEDLPVDFEIEYVRVWQQPSPNLLDRAFFGFEGPMVLEDNPIPRNDKGLEQFWYIGEESKPFFSISEEKPAVGRKCMKFSHRGKLKLDQVAAMAPYGTVDLPAGEYTLSMKLWLDPAGTVKKIHPILEAPWLQIAPLDLSGIPRGEWVTMTQAFTRAAASSEKDRLRLVVHQEDVPGGESVLLIDEISIGTLEGK